MVRGIEELELQSVDTREIARLVSVTWAAVVRAEEI